MITPILMLTPNGTNNSGRKHIKKIIKKNSRISSIQVSQFNFVNLKSSSYDTIIH